jgi:hypothetical protein
MTLKLKSITSTSWLVIKNDSNIGLLSETNSEYIFISNGKKEIFQDKHAVLNYFGQDIFNNLSIPVVESAKISYINSFPVDFDNPKEVSIKDNTLPLYSKKTDSNVYYAAGYYCLEFPSNIMPAFCPKLSTLENYKYSGPFKTEVEMRVELGRLKKAIK